MKKKFLTLIVSIIAMLICIFGLVACNEYNGANNKPNGKGQVPVYQGMTISNGQSTALTAKTMSISLMSAKKPGNTDNNGNHNGWYNGDHNGKHEDVDQENPFPENGNNENIETEIDSTLDVIGAEQEIYYATANEDIYINIHISNPDNYEIMSFTLNGKKYSSYMFEEGSDMETLVLKYNVGSESGIQEYTIDAIKYIDGTDIKDVIMYGDKTVLAGVRIENQVNATIFNATIQTNALSFNVKINDNDNLISYSQGCLKAVVYDGESVVAIKDLTVGDNNVFFDNLAISTLYQYAIVGYYDDLSGEGFAMNTLYKEAFYTKAIVLFDDIVVSQESIEFSFVWDSEFQNKTLTALKLYKGNTLTELSATATAVNNLLSNTIYTLIAEYKNGEKTENISLEFKTEAKAVPVVEIASPTKTQTSVGFAINETDTDNVGAVTKIELIHANGTVVADSLDVREFTGLLSNNTYTVKVTYAYDLNDGVGLQEIVKTLDIKTEAKAVPVVEIASPTKTQTSISGEYAFTDIDNVGNINSVKIYKGETLIAENTDKEILFTNLEYYTEYKIVIAYSYDLNDGDGVQWKNVEENIKTEPFIDAKTVQVLNISDIYSEETVYLSIELNNPLNASVVWVMINGTKYNVSSGSSAGKVYVDVIIDEQFIGGNTELIIEKMSINLSGNIYIIDLNGNVRCEVFINGKFDVVSVEFVDENFNSIDWAFPNDKVYVMLNLENPTGYEIDLGTGVADLKKQDDNHYYYPIKTSQGWNTARLSSVTYKNENITKTVTYTDKMVKCYVVQSNETHYITKPTDLLNMSTGYYYELKNDIDLQGLQWFGNSMVGVFDGKGYSIKNMSVVGTFKNQDLYLGLFTSLSGVVKNVNMQDVLYRIEHISDLGDNYLNYGTIATETSYPYSIIKNCSVNDGSIVELISNTERYLFVGGVTGDTYGKIENCINRANIICSSAANCMYVGGIVGVISNSDMGIVINCFNAGMIQGNYDVGGIVGMNDCTIKNCINVGEIKKYSSGWSLGGIVGNNRYGTVENCYTNKNYNSNDSHIDETRLKSESFYAQILGWDKAVWVLEDGQYPKLCFELE